MNRNKRYNLWITLLITILVLLTGCSSNETTTNGTDISSNTDNSTIISLNGGVFDYASIPEYIGEPYVEVNNNIPYFTEEEIVSESYEEYGELDALGRCTSSIACLSTDTMPGEDEERGAIGHIKPTGWYSVKYDCVEGRYVMNRAHCIGWQLSNENDEERNLVSSSRYLNIEMLQYENMVAEYIRETKNHVMYRVTPVFVDDELLCRGLLMEGYSVEDDGQAICYCVFFYNVQPGIEFDYSTGESWYTGEFLDMDSVAVNYDAVETNTAVTEETEEVSPLPEEGQECVYIINRSSKKFHTEFCDSISTMKESNKEVFEGNREYLISIGYEPCGNCNP